MTNTQTKPTPRTLDEIATVIHQKYVPRGDEEKYVFGTWYYAGLGLALVKTLCPENEWTAWLKENYSKGRCAEQNAEMLIKLARRGWDFNFGVVEKALAGHLDYHWMRERMTAAAVFYCVSENITDTTTASKAMKFWADTVFCWLHNAVQVCAVGAIRQKIIAAQSPAIAWIEQMQEVIDGPSVDATDEHAAMLCARLADSITFVRHIQQIEPEDATLGQLLAAVTEIVDLVTNRRGDIGPLSVCSESLYDRLRVADETMRTLVEKSSVEPTYQSVMPGMLRTLKEDPTNETARAFLLRCGRVTDGEN